MKEQFKKYLVQQGYKEFTPSGNPSTVYDYLKRIDKVCEWERIDWIQLAENIGAVVTKYDVGGSKEELGKKSHNAVISALKRYREFVNSK